MALAGSPGSPPRVPSLGAVLILALDTATPQVVVGILEWGDSADRDLSEPVVRAASRVSSGNRHAETLGESIPAVLSQAGVGMSDFGAIVVGLGPGPFTGLRVGLMTAAALADALILPAYGVCTHDAIAASYASSSLDEGFVVVTDARRRECYWAGYDATGTRTSGPHVQRPADVRARSGWSPSGLVIGDEAFSESLGTDIVPTQPDPVGLVLAARGIGDGTAPEPLVPLYLRRPDAMPPAARKPVTPR